MREQIKRPPVPNADEFDALYRRRYTTYSALHRRKMKRWYRRLERRLGKKECRSDARSSMAPRAM
jgi:hypothetical protein